MLIDTQAGIDDDEATRARYRAMLDTWLTAGPGRSRRPGGRRAHPRRPRSTGSRGRRRAGATPRGTASGRRRPALIEREDITRRVGEIRCPAIVFHGTADLAIPMEKATQLLEEMAACEELVRIADAGHAANVSHPAEVNGPLAAFMRRHVS